MAAASSALGPLQATADHLRRTTLLALGVISAPREWERRSYVRPALRAIDTTELAFRFVLGDAQRSGLKARLDAEQVKWRDICFLPVPDVGKQRLSEKTLHWFHEAVRLFPRAMWYAKTDTDSFLVWERLRHPLRWLAAHPAWDSERYFLGKLAWTSYLVAKRTFCGCCAHHAEHGRLLQTAPDAAWGPCASAADRASPDAPVRYSRQHNSSVRGPFPFAGGSFYAISASLARWLSHSRHAWRMRQRMRAGRLSGRMMYTEDAFFGGLVERCRNMTVIATSWDLIANLDEAGTPHLAFHGRARRCFQAAHLLADNLTTGAFTPWRSPETVSPMQAVVHKVSTRAQFGRVQRLVDSWRGLGPQPCFLLPLVVKYRHGQPIYYRTHAQLPRLWPGAAKLEPRVRYLLENYWTQDRF